MLVGGVAFILGMIALCLYLDEQPDTHAFILTNTNAIGAIAIVLALLCMLMGGFVAGFLSGNTGPGTLAGLTVGGSTAFAFLLIPALVTPAWYNVPGARYGNLLAYLVFVGGVLAILAVGVGALAGLIAGAIGAAMKRA
jgi:hypothetical protein